jgi:hypothetical protein
MAQFKTNPWPLETLLAQLRTGKIVLPQFQRSFVWDAGDIDLLLTSLAKDYPAGSLLFLRVDPSNPLAWRPVEGIDVQSSAEPDYLVLDGQQRLTSLFYALTGQGRHRFFADVRRLHEGDTDGGIFWMWRREVERRHADEREVQFANDWLPLTKLIGPDADTFWLMDYLRYHADEGVDEALLRTRVQEVDAQYLRTLRNYQFPVIELPADTDLEAVCQIFETLNKTGVRLTVFDLLTARFWPLGIDLRHMWEHALSTYPLLGGEEFGVDPVTVLQAVSLRRAGVCRRSDLLLLTDAGFVDEWNRALEAGSAALAFLRGECGVLSRQWLYCSLPREMCLTCPARLLLLDGRRFGDGSGVQCSTSAMTAPPIRRTRLILDSFANGSKTTRQFRTLLQSSRLPRSD